MDNIVVSIIIIMIGIFCLMMTCYLSLCFIQWIGDLLEGLKGRKK